MGTHRYLVVVMLHFQLYVVGCSRARVLSLLPSVSIFSSPADPLVHYLAFSPVVDGDFLPDKPENLFANAADIDYIAGVNNMDGHFFASIDMPEINRPLVKITP